MYTLWSAHKCNHVCLTEMKLHTKLRGKRHLHCVSLPAHELVRGRSLFTIIGSHGSNKWTWSSLICAGVLINGKKTNSGLVVCAQLETMCLYVWLSNRIYTHTLGTNQSTSDEHWSQLGSLWCFLIMWLHKIIERGHCVS